MDQWVVGSDPSERFPLWTRANVGEVFPDPVQPLTFTLMIEETVEGAFRDAFVEMGAFTHDEFTEGKMEMLGVFGSYCYLNASLFRIFGERAPGLSAEDIDALFFGAQPGIPAYEAQPGDTNAERSAAIGEVFQWVMTTETLEAPLAGEKLVSGIRDERPDHSSMTNEELWSYSKDLLLTHFRGLFKEHIFITFLSTVPVGALTQICEAIGRPGDTMKLISGVGDVESAAPSQAMWEMGRIVAADQDLVDLFDQGTSGLYERLTALPDGSSNFMLLFDKFLHEYGARGPNEWEPSKNTWETQPELALAAIDRMRLADGNADPKIKGAAMTADREKLSVEIAEILAGDPETQGMFLAAARSAVIFQAGRERTKTNCIKLEHEVRLAMFTLGRRFVDAGLAENVSDFALLTSDQIDEWIKDPAAFRDVINSRRSLQVEYAEITEPFVFYGIQPDPSEWVRRDANVVDLVKAGDVLQGFPGCPGTVTGIARIVTDPMNPRALAPGEILVAPLTDPSWTPLFVAAGGVIVNVGAAQSHAMIVSRELGIPCVPSVTNATQSIPDGAEVTVDGDNGTVTINSVP